MHIQDLRPDDEQVIQQTAAMLVAGFREHYPNSWPDMTSAVEEVRESLTPNHISRVALDDSGNVLGWIGGNGQYDGNVWELHPLVVKPGHHGHGVGRALVLDFEERVRERGAYTITLGTDDEDNQTSLSGVNLYPDVCEHIRTIRNLRHHPFEFYQKLGFVIFGVLPDANGPGKPDILMAKSVRR